MKFENWNRTDLMNALQKRGWSRLGKAVPNIAGQLHQWYFVRNIKGYVPQKRTLRNAARIAGLIQ